MKLFLDDVRIPKDCVPYMHKRIGRLNLLYLEDWTIVRDFHSFCKAVQEHYKEITHISFDHDLAEGHYHDSMYNSPAEYTKHLETVKEKTGFDCARWMKYFYLAKKKNLPVMFVHSMNPIGTQNIINLFKNP